MDEHLHFGYVLTFMGLPGLLNLSIKAGCASKKEPKNISEIEFTTINSANAQPTPM